MVAGRNLHLAFDFKSIIPSLEKVREILYVDVM
jgi:hypothetical protein